MVKKVRAFIGELASVFAVQVQRGTLRRDAHEPLQFDPRPRFRLQPGPPFRLLGPRLRRRQCNARGGTVDPRQERSLDAKTGICKMDARLKIVSKNSSWIALMYIIRANLGVVPHVVVWSFCFKMLPCELISHVDN